jgi:hypothetical protein
VAPVGFGCLLPADQRRLFEAKPLHLVVVELIIVIGEPRAVDYLFRGNSCRLFGVLCHRSHGIVRLDISGRVILLSEPRMPCSLCWPHSRTGSQGVRSKTSLKGDCQHEWNRKRDTGGFDQLKVRLKATWVTRDYDLLSRCFEKDAEQFFRPHSGTQAA